MGLVGLRYTLAGGLFLGLLAFPVGAGKGVDGAAAFGKIDGLCRGDAGIGRGDRLGRDAVVGAEYHHLLAADRRGRGKMCIRDSPLA